MLRDARGSSMNMSRYVTIGVKKSRFLRYVINENNVNMTSCRMLYFMVTSAIFFVMEGLCDKL